MFNKVIITNVAALKSKYGAGFSKIEKAVGTLIKADKKRGLTTGFFAIDSADQMKTVKGKNVTSPASQKQVKAAVDAIYTALVPDYLLLLGGPDIVPFQALKNPCFHEDGDDDANVPSDLPYACSAPYSRDPAKFLGPTRIVGRIPDLPGVKNTTLLAKLLSVAAKAVPRVRSEYKEYFGISAEVWKKSTGLSLRNLFGSDAAMATVPDKGPVWPDPYLAHRVHFINCHGSPVDPRFYGQRGEDYPVAHQAESLPGKIATGTVVAAECCYGAQLYDPANSEKQEGICIAYLRGGAYGFVGSSTIAYGPSSGNGQADYICQYFVDSVLGGGSLGRALLEARQRFGSNYTHVDPTDLKTMAQFYLLGDPSLQAVLPETHALATTKAFKSVSGQSTAGTRVLRREKMVRAGINLGRSLGSVRDKPESIPASVSKTLELAARESGLKGYGKKSFSVTFPASANTGDMKLFALERSARSVHMYIGKNNDAKKSAGRIMAIIATVEKGKIIHLRRVHSR